MPDQVKLMIPQYNGKMSHKAREEAVEKFRENADTKIMIASLKCGGIGLVSVTLRYVTLGMHQLNDKIEFDHGKPSNLC